jgi:tRNA pseudouridine55 synthase
MKDRKNKNPSPSGVILFAKNSGETSFSSLWSIKNALSTEKVGHTGTLDSFADGLLVVLSGAMTHLVSHVTGFTKTYLAVVCFGKETDTLDPAGKIIRKGKAVSRKEVENALEKFRGAILQTPPEYSALHVNGKRASDLVREGKKVFLESRQVFVYKNSLVDFKDADETDGCSYALLEIVCSKGTYIRSIARDLGIASGTCAHLCALRRTQVGIFKLQDAAGFSALNEFSIANAIESEKKFQAESAEMQAKRILLAKKSGKRIARDDEKKISEIREKFFLFTEEIASRCGFSCDVLKPQYQNQFLNGRPLSQKMFAIKNRGSLDEIAVFYEDGNFGGMMKKNPEGKLSYSFVVPPEKKEFRVFSWNEFLREFPVQWRAKGTALTVGSFEAVHLGHLKIMETVASQKNLVPGIVTFSASIKNRTTLFPLDERLRLFENAGLSFAVVIDFDDDFAKIDGKKFVEKLLVSCGMKFLCEGRDFTCGYKGSVNMDELKKIAAEKKFVLECSGDVLVDGEKVSSSRVRAEMEKGNFRAAEKFLGRKIIRENSV